MTIPAITQSWLISANNRYVFSTVIGATQAAIFSVKGFLKTTVGLTVKGSCTAGTGAMDGTDRWASAADVTPRNNGSAGSQAWFVLTDGNAADVCLSFNSASDDIFRLAHSPGGLYVAAGTANNQPTATDECPSFTTTASWFNATASGDRIWNLWGTADKKMWRCVVGRLSAFQSLFGLERLTNNVIAPAIFVGPSIANIFLNSNASGTTVGSATGSSSTSGGSRTARVHVNGADANVPCGGAGEAFLGQASSGTFGTERPELQGSAGEILVPLGCASGTTNQSGKLGNHYDWWYAYSNSLIVFGDVFGNFQLFAAGDGIILPWDGSTQTVQS